MQVTRWTALAAVNTPPVSSTLASEAGIHTVTHCAGVATAAGSATLDTTATARPAAAPMPPACLTAIGTRLEALWRLCARDPCVVTTRGTTVVVVVVELLLANSWCLCVAKGKGGGGGGVRPCTAASDWLATTHLEGVVAGILRRSGTAQQRE